MNNSPLQRWAIERMKYLVSPSSITSEDEAFISELITAAKEEALRDAEQIYRDNQREWSPEVLDGFRELLESARTSTSV